MSGEGIGDTILPLLKGGVRAVGNLLKRSGAQDLLKRTLDSLLKTGKQQVKRIAKESLPKLAEKAGDLAKDAIISKIEGKQPVNVSDEIRKQIELEVKKQAKTTQEAFQNVIDPAKMQAREVLQGVIGDTSKKAESEVRRARDRLSNLISGNGLYFPGQLGAGLRLLGD
jgi:hypothetical protein